MVCLLSRRFPVNVLKKQMQQLGCTHQLTVKDVRWQSAKSLSCKYSYNQLADIIFTSGTTGQPKAAVHTLGNHYFSARGANEHIPFSANDRWLLSLPLYHVGGLGILFRVFLRGGTLVIAQPQENLQKVLTRYRITHVSLVSTQLYRLLQNNFSGQYLKAILLGGSAIPERLLKQAVQKKLPVYTTYGLTEMSSQVATSQKLSYKDSWPWPRILNYRQVKIARDGEILVKGKTLFKGYLKVNKIQKIRRWFKTGDLGYLNQNKELTVTGRKDKMFISGGENIQPAEIEYYLRKREDVKEVAVIAKADAEFGFRPVAFVTMKKGKKFNPAQLKSCLQKYLPKFKIPDLFRAEPQS